MHSGYFYILLKSNLFFDIALIYYIHYFLSSSNHFHHLYYYVFLNKKFKTYPKSGKDTDFLCTIIASVYFLIIKKLRGNGNHDDEIIRSIFNGSDEFEEFSVCSVMSYFFGMSKLTFDNLQKMTDEKLMAELQKEVNDMCGGALQ